MGVRSDGRVKECKEDFVLKKERTKIIYIYIYVEREREFLEKKDRNKERKKRTKI